MPNIQLRPYQQKFIDDIRNEFKLNHKRVVGVAPCGAGKTIMTGWMIRQALNRGKRSIFFVHRHELIEQTAKTFYDLDIPFGVIESGFKSDLSLPVQIAAVQTLAKRIDKIPKPDFLICDECHHILANTYKKILDKWSDAYLLGVTATPQRMGGKNLGDVFDSMVQSLSVNELIQLGNLTKFRYFAPYTDIDLSKVDIVGGDYNSDQLESIMADKKITGNIVNHYVDFAEGKSAICYCVNVKHSKSVADAFIQAGISAAHVDGDTPKHERALLVEDFRNGKIKVLCNAELFGEGFDVPKCQAVILARPTKSLTLYIQQAMRAMRPDPDDTNKVAIIIDCVQNYLRHGKPNDFREWSLNPTVDIPVPCPACGKLIVPVLVKNSKGKVIKIKVDDNNQPLRDEHGEILNFKDGSQRRQCPKCGYIFPLGKTDNYGRHAQYKEGEIIEQHISFDDTKTAETVIRKPDEAESFKIIIDNFLLIAAKKNYKRGWAAYRALYYANSYEDCLVIADICGLKKGWAWYRWAEIKNNTGA